MLKGILLAGGANTRLYPLTLTVCKQLLPVYDKPMIFYPFSTLLTCGCEEILIITRNERDQCSIMEMFPPALFGVKLRYVIQPKPLGLADAFRIANRHDFLSPSDYVVMMLGDNLLHGAGLDDFLRRSVRSNGGQARAFFHQMHNKMPHLWQCGYLMCHGLRLPQKQAPFCGISLNRMQEKPS